MSRSWRQAGKAIRITAARQPSAERYCRQRRQCHDDGARGVASFGSWSPSPNLPSSVGLS
jgi:hypothetical protein